GIGPALEASLLAAEDDRRGDRPRVAHDVDEGRAGVEGRHVRDLAVEAGLLDRHGRSEAEEPAQQPRAVHGKVWLDPARGRPRPSPVELLDRDVSESLALEALAQPPRRGEPVPPPGAG